MSWTREKKIHSLGAEGGKYFMLLLIWGQNYSKLCKQNFAGS